VWWVGEFLNQIIYSSILQPSKTSRRVNSDAASQQHTRFSRDPLQRPKRQRLSLVGHVWSHRVRSQLLIN